MKSPGGLYVPVLWKEDSDGLLLHFLPSQIWPGGQQRPVALLAQNEPFGQQTLPQELWPCSQQRPIALLAQNEPCEQQTTLPPTLPQGVSPGPQLPLSWTARAVPDPKAEA